MYNKAILLRHRGFSYNEIVGHIPVAKSTISRWCSGISLTEEQKDRLIEKKRNTSLICGLRERATKSKKDAKVWAGGQINKLSNRNREQLLLVSGILLYWAEGASSEKNVEFTNTAPEIIKIIMEFFRKILKVPENKFRIMVRIGSEGDAREAEIYWSKVTGVPRENFHRVEILKLTQNSKSLKKHPYGICRIHVFDTSMSRKLLALIKEFSKKFALVA